MTILQTYLICVSTLHAKRSRIETVVMPSASILKQLV